MTETYESLNVTARCTPAISYLTTIIFDTVCNTVFNINTYYLLLKIKT